jgi:hypothetical protein
MNKTTREILYKRWDGMKDRCRRSSHVAYKDYGGRGIKICDEWKTFENFYPWAIKSGFQPELSLDRINTNGNYEPTNCRWATAEEQQRNRRDNNLTEEVIQAREEKLKEIRGNK